jgi:hypothetical protein
MVAKWLSNLMHSSPPPAVVYHFVGCTSRSTALPEVLTRLICGLYDAAGDSSPPLKELEINDLATAFLTALDVASRKVAAPLCVHFR